MPSVEICSIVFRSVANSTRCPLPRSARSPPEGNRCPSLRPKSTTSRAWSRRPSGLPPAAAVGRRGFLKGAAGAGVALTLPALLAACGGSSDRRAAAVAAGQRADRHRDLRLQRLRRRAEEGLRRRLRRVRRRSHEAARPRSTPSTTTRSRSRSTTTCRAARTTSSPGSPATGCGSSPRRASPATSATSGTRSAATSPTRFKKASTGDDGKQYFVPLYNYPWALIYRKSVLAEHGLHGAHDAGRADDARRHR